MVDLELLARRARRASEWGRLRGASRVAILVVPLILLALLLTPHRAAVVGLGLALLAAAVALRWSGAEGARAARSGLQLGALPLSAALATIALETWCDPSGAVTLCGGAGCLLAGLVAGGASAWYAVRTRSARRLRVWSQIGLVASLTTALGCVGLGLGSALAVLTALAAGAAVAWIPARGYVKS